MFETPGGGATFRAAPVSETPEAAVLPFRVGRLPGVAAQTVDRILVEIVPLDELPRAMLEPAPRAIADEPAVAGNLEVIEQPGDFRVGLRWVTEDGHDECAEE